MKIKPDEIVGNLLLYTNADSLTPKAKAAKKLYQFEDIINKKVEKILEALDTILIIIPSIVISEGFYPFIDEIINENIHVWKKFTWLNPLEICLECLNFDNDIVLFRKDLSLSFDNSKIIDDINRFVTLHKPEQIIISIKYNSTAGTIISSRSVPGNTLIEAEKSPENLNDFKKALKIITPVADAVFIKKNKNYKNLPKYRFIGFYKDGVSFLNMLDYKT